MTAKPNVITREELAAIRERAEKATPGPWRWSNAKVLNGKYDFVPQGSYLADTLIMFGDTYENGEHDAEFIAHAREDIPRLLDALEAAYDREAKMVAALRAISEESPDLGARECADEALEELGYGKEDAE